MSSKFVRLEDEKIRAEEADALPAQVIDEGFRDITLDAMIPSPKSAPVKALALAIKDDEYHPRQRKTIVRFILVCFILTQIFVNYDSGGIPSVLEDITQEFNLKETLLGLLGALPYIGLVCSASLIGILMQKLSQKSLLLVSLFTNVWAVFMLAMSWNVWVLFVSRFLIGVSLVSLSMIFILSVC